MQDTGVWWAVDSSVNSGLDHVNERPGVAGGAKVNGRANCASLYHDTNPSSHLPVISTTRYLTSSMAPPYRCGKVPAASLGASLGGSSDRHSVVTLHHLAAAAGSCSQQLRWL